MAKLAKCFEPFDKFELFRALNRIMEVWFGGELVYVHGMGVKAAAKPGHERKNEPAKLRRFHRSRL